MLTCSPLNCNDYNNYEVHLTCHHASVLVIRVLIYSLSLSLLSPGGYYNEGSLHYLHFSHSLSLFGQVVRWKNGRKLFPITLDIGKCEHTLPTAVEYHDFLENPNRFVSGLLHTDFFQSGRRIKESRRVLWVWLIGGFRKLHVPLIISVNQGHCIYEIVSY